MFCYCILLVISANIHIVGLSHPYKNPISNISFIVLYSLISSAKYMNCTINYYRQIITQNSQVCKTLPCGMQIFTLTKCDFPFCTATLTFVIQKSSYLIFSFSCNSISSYIILQPFKWYKCKCLLRVLKGYVNVFTVSNHLI